MLLIPGSALLLYLSATGYCLGRLLHHQGPNRKIVFALAGGAVGLHLIWLFNHILLASGQDLSIVNVASLVSMLISAVMTAMLSRYKVWVLLPVVYALAAMNLLLETFVPGQYITHLESRPTILVHISLALFAYCTLMVGCLYALQLAYLDYSLKNKRPMLHPALPPLMVVEKQLFIILSAGALLLALSISTGLLFIQDILAPGQAHKIVLSIIALIIYGILIWGHYQKGWRGRPVVCATVVGAFLLTLAYFGSRFVQEVLLGN